jgi:hypothetical protein
MSRLINRLGALVVGAVLMAGGGLVVIEAVWTWTGSGFVWIPGRAWLSSFKTTPWSHNAVIAISIGVAIVGFLVVIIEVRPQPKRVAPYRSDHGTWLLLRRSTEAHLSRRLETAVATTPIKVRLSPRALRWRLKVTARAARSTRPALEAAARAELDLLHAPSARVQVRTTGSKK